MVQLAEKPLDVAAWDLFDKLGMPQNSWEAYRYVNLETLYNTAFSLPQFSLVARQPQNNTLVFINGSYCEELSLFDKPWVVLELNAAHKTYGQFLQSRKSKWLQEENDPIAALNGAYCAKGLFLYLPPGSHGVSPLRIMHVVSSSAAKAILCPRIQLYVAKGASGSLLYSQEHNEASIWNNSFIDVALDEGSELSCGFLSRQHESAHDFLSVRATLKKRAIFKSYSATNGSATSRQDYSVRLQGSESSASLSGVSQVKNHRQHHVHVFMEHAAENCHSLQKFKNIVNDHAQVSFEGKIYVHPEAQKTNAYQMNNNLILSEKASAFAKPNLEILADDVKASHGATFGQLDQEHLFYLLARGCSLEVAHALLTEGFCSEIVAELKKFDSDADRFLQ